MKIDLTEVSIIIPVKDNQAGINAFFKSFFDTQSSENYPKEIIIIDNNSENFIYLPDQYLNQGIEILLLTCSRQGPASARNEGVKRASGQWILFVDSDCIATASLLSGYLKARYGAIAYAGSIDAVGKDFLSRYYITQQIHWPPRQTKIENDLTPRYLITANALVLKSAFDAIGGFNESFTLAAGEDIDLGIRLAHVGRVFYAPDSIAMHDFDDGIAGFMKRFIRYGKGNRLIRHFHQIPMFPMPSTAKKKSVLINNILVVIQWICLLIGYIKMDIVLKKKKLSK